MIAEKSALSVWLGKDPIGMRAVKLAVGVDHFGLDPESEQKICFMACIGNNAKTVRKALGIDSPIAKTCFRADTPGHPSVINDQKLSAHVLNLRNEGEQLFLGYVKQIGIP